MEPNNPSGYVYTHREVGARSIGRPLKPGECVHHVDEDKLNNDPTNLMVFRTNGDHARFHGGGTLVGYTDGTWSTIAKVVIALCATCGCQKKSTKGQLCVSCSGNDKASKLMPSRDALIEIVDRMPMTAAGELLGVTDNAVRKWCKKLDIPMKPQGYWVSREGILTKRSRETA